MKILKIMLLGLALVLGVVSCKKAAVETHTTTGVIRAIQSEGRVLVIEHQAFPGWMEAMTMPFELKDSKLAEGLKVNDKVEFTLTAETNGYPITAIKKLDH